MAMADPYAATYSKIVELLKAEPTLFDPAAANRALVWDANFIDYSGTSPQTRNPRKPTEILQAGDFPALYVDEDSEADTGILGTQRTFGQCDWHQQASLAIAIWIVAGDTRLPLISALRWATKIALQRGGVTLGLKASGVFKWTMQSKTFIANTPQIVGGYDITGTKICRICKITVPVSFDWHGPSLTA